MGVTVSESKSMASWHGAWQQVDRRGTGAVTEADTFRSNHEAQSELSGNSTGV